MNNRLIIQDLAGILAEHTGKDKNSTEQFLREFVTVISKGVFEDKIVKVKGLGTFKIIPVEKRESIHVNTGERFLIPEHYKFSFSPDKELKELVNKPFSFFETTELGDHIEFTDMDVSEEPEDKEGEDESVEEVIPDKELPIQEFNLICPDQEEKEEIPPTVEVISPEPEVVVEEALQESAEEEDILPEEVSEEIAEITEELKVPPVEPDQTVEKCPEPEHRVVPSHTSSIKTALIGIGLIAIIGVVLYLNRGLFVTPEVPAIPENPVSVPDNRPASIAPVVPLPIDSVEIEILQHVEPENSEKSAKPQQNPEIIATVKIESGSRLTLISQEYYGSKLFWVYLYEYNKSKIKDPNNIPVGTEIEVPAPEKYGINAQDRASTEKAAARQTEILSGEL